MAFVVRTNQNYSDGDDLIDNGVDGLHQLFLDAGWTLFDTLDADAGEQDRVYYSTGEDGEQALYLRVTHEAVTRRVHFRAYSLWSASGDVGYNGIGDVAGNTCFQYRAVAFDAWIALDKDNIAVVIDFDGGTTYNKFFGGLVTPLVSSQRTFNGRLGPPITGYNTSGDTKLRMASGTDYSDLEADQYLWLVSQSASENPSNTEKVQITGYDQPTETIFLNAALTKSFPLGSLVSMIPQEVVLWGNAAGQLVNATVYALHNTDAYASQQMSWSTFLDSIGLTTVPSSDYGEYHLAPVVLYDGTVNQRNVMGQITRFRRAPTGSASAEDTFTAGSDQSVNFPDGGGFFALQVTA